MISRIFIIALLCCLSTGHASAHGDLHERIQETTKEIEAAPDSAYLYFKRGKLYFHHEEYQHCLTDLQQARYLGYNDTFQQLLFAKSHYRLQEYRPALEYLDRILQDDPHHVNALKTRARIHFDQKNYRQAALSYELVIEHSIRSFPENYIDASYAWELLGTEEGRSRSILIIERGIAELGPIISLYDHLRDMCLRYHYYEQALAAQQAIIASSHRKEKAYYQFAEIYLLQGNTEAAAVHLSLARQAVEQLPARIRQTEAMLQLIQQIEEKLLALPKKP